MSKFSRRSFVSVISATTAALSMPSIAFGARARVVVIGGGAGGATAAKYIAKSVGAERSPYLTPLSTLNGSERSPPKFTRAFMSE